MYKVIKYFTDLQDNNRPYNVGDTFPHIECCSSVTEKRLSELSSEKNLQNQPLIRCVEEDSVEAPKKKRAKKTAEK